MRFLQARLRGLLKLVPGRPGRELLNSISVVIQLGLAGRSLLPSSLMPVRLGVFILLTSGLRSLASLSAGGARKNWNDLPSPREQFAEKRLVAVESMKDYLRMLDAGKSVRLRYSLASRERHRSRPNV